MINDKIQLFTIAFDCDIFSLSTLVCLKGKVKYAFYKLYPGHNFFNIVDDFYLRNISHK